MSFIFSPVVGMSCFLISFKNSHLKYNFCLAQSKVILPGSNIPLVRGGRREGGSFGMAVLALFHSGFPYITFAQAQSGCRLETAQPVRVVHSGFI